MPGSAARLVAAVEEEFLVPVCTSRHASLWVAGHRALSWPLLRTGEIAMWSAPAGNRTVRVATVGKPKRFAEWLARLGAAAQATDVASAAVRRLPLRSPAVLGAAEPDLVLAHIHRWKADRFRQAGWLTVPSAIRWCAPAHQVPPAVPSHSLKSDLRMLDRFGATHEMADAPADWEEFFAAMVEPEARARFGAEAWIPSARLRRRLVARGTLHFVRKDGVRVAGTCALPTARGVWLPVGGVRHGDAALLRAGAATAAMAATLRWAAAMGFATVDLGRTSPFLDDGVARVKAKWGFRPVPEPLAHLIAVRARPESADARRLLARTGVWCETAAGLEISGGARDDD